MEKLCKQAAEKFVDELKKEENREKIETEVLDPVIKYIGQRLYPYVVTVSLMLCVTLLLLTYVIVCLRFRGHHLGRIQ